MNGIALTMRALHQGEQALTERLTVIAARHTREHEVRHVTRDLARWSIEHRRRLAETGRHYGLRLEVPSAAPSESSTDDRHHVAEVVGRTSESLPELLRDLRELHLGAAGNSLHWVMLGQAAQASKDTRLLDVVSFCHPRTLRQMHWSNTMIKNLSPQLLTVGDEQNA
ncbi:hypothetical protein ACIP3B_24375 [Streptomyces anulatus]|uniref:hypothetical protein n=1 Tax=Streptomyces TaxID=1883 RepID=UPI001E2A7C50|nr:hypothetical protein [Streptomyces sp. DH7]